VHIASPVMDIGAHAPFGVQ